MISKSCKYAFRATILLASKSEEGVKLSVKEIAEEIEAPQAFTGKVLQILKKHSIINSLKGPYGGFFCEKRHLKIPAIEIVNAIDGLTMATYNIMLNGQPFTTIDGDMAAGCADAIGDVDADTDPINPITFGAQATTSALSTYPNPTEGPSKVVFTTVETTRTLVEVYDMNGRNVATLFDQEAQQDQQYTLDFNGSKLPNGVYIYRLTTNNETIIEKFMIAR